MQPGAAKQQRAETLCLQCFLESNHRLQSGLALLHQQTPLLSCLCSYATDDGTNVGFFRFVADKPRDFSSGEACYHLVRILD